MRKILFLLLIAAGPIAAQSINPATQIVWPRVTGSGAPTLTCGSIEYGMPYTDLSQNPAVSYHCTTHGWQTDSGGGTVGPGTNKFFACFSGTTNVGNCHADDGATTASTVTVTEPVVVSPSGGTAGNIKFGQGTTPSFTSGNGYVFSDASGNMMSNDNAAGSGNICNTVNGKCQPPTTFQTGGVNNSSQTTLNLVAGTNVTLTNTSGGNVTIAASGGGGSGAYISLIPSITPTGCTVSGNICTVGSAVASVTLASIPGTSHDLDLVVLGWGTNAATNTYEPLLITFNSDSTAANYVAAQFLFQVGGTISASGGSSSSGARVGFINYTGNSPIPGTASMKIRGYASTSYNKQITGDSWVYQTSAAISEILAGTYWLSNSAITSITIQAQSGDTIAAGTQITLDGVN